MSKPFDLDTAIAVWRRRYEHDRSFLPEDIRELEQHVRDHVAVLVEEGQEERVAFLKVMRETGEHEAVRAAYREVCWAKLRRHRQVKDEWIWRGAMLKNYFNVALRSLRKRSGYSAIHVFGLSVGIACCLLIGVYLHEELSYDRHHEQADRIYRVTNLDLTTGKQWAPIGPPVGLALAEQLSGIESVTRFIPLIEGIVLGTETQRFKESGGLYADASVFEVFTVPLLQGNTETALVEPNTLVLTERMARKYFGSKNPLGQTLTLNGYYDLRVTGVMRDLPSTTHLPFDFLVSVSTFYARAGDWVHDAKTWSGFYTYVLLEEGLTAERLEAQVPGFIEGFYEPQGTGPATDDRRLVFQALADIHLHSQLEKELQPNGKVAYVRLFGCMAVFLLLLAVINFVNLATARTVERAQEVGVRKTLGAVQGGLIVQFLIEATLLVCTAFGIAYALVQGVLPVFRQFSGKALTGHVLTEPLVLVGLLGLALVLSVLAGGYPSFVLARLQPRRVFKGGHLSIRQGTRLREGLIVTQFVVAIALLAGTGTIYRQMQFLTTATLGFDKEHLIDVRISPAAEQEVGRQAEALKQTLLQQPTIEAATLVSGIPGERHPLNRFELAGRDGERRAEGYQMRVVFGADHDYVSTLGLRLLSGRDFSNVQVSDTNGAFLLNEAAARALNLRAEEAIGKTLSWSGESYTGEVIGIVEDFHYASLHHEVEPLVIPLRPRFTNSHLLIRVKEVDAEGAVRAVEGVWNRVVPGVLFDYAFLDAEFDALYRSEMRMSRVVTAFSMMALGLACLGLFGLSTLMVAQRTKEIGVRKVLGASVTSILALLSKGFLKLVGIAFVIAAPMAYFLVQGWLENFAYRIQLGPGVFLLAGALVLFIALLTVSYQSVKTALADPVESLRYE